MEHNILHSWIRFEEALETINSSRVQLISQILEYGSNVLKILAMNSIQCFWKCPLPPIIVLQSNWTQLEKECGGMELPS